jgi:hypothetical protein
MQTLHRVLVNGIFVAGYPPQSSTPVMARQMRVHIALQAMNRITANPLPQKMPAKTRSELHRLHTVLESMLPQAAG